MAAGIPGALPTAVQIASAYGRPLSTGEAPKVIGYTLRFPTPVFNSDTYNIQIGSTVGIFSGIRSIFVDASAMPNQTFITFSDSGTLVIRPFTRGWYPITSASLAFSVRNATGVGQTPAATIKLLVSNMAVRPTEEAFGNLLLAGGDVLQTERFGLSAGSAQASSTTWATTVLVPSLLVAGTLGYFVNAVNAVFFAEKAGAEADTVITLGDWNAGLGAFNFIFMQWRVMVSAIGPVALELCNQSHFNFIGTGQLGIQGAANLAGTTAFISVNVSGGSTNFPGN